MRARKTLEALSQTTGATSSEHRDFACAATGYPVRCFGLSGVQLRWPHRLQVCVPMCAIVCALLVSAAVAQSEPQFAKANQDYAQGHFKEAIDGYETLVRSGQWSANLFYDLGNAYFRTNDFGRAILNYERSLALEQHHPEATANLQIARDEAHALELQQSWPDRYLRFASINQYSITAVVAFWIGVFCLITLIFARRRPAAAIVLLVLAFSTFSGAIFAIWQLDRGAKGRTLAIVTA